ncbi:hypothetical protein TCE0_017r04306 [Talaromyces pinophilus]|uniref:Uncharacterized protein n=1 Tax=Talaromyces pinophilus TaxID=128442 RepID=A0A6V8H3A1_TALPI|nr:hypothetical protein TCE0_017r04306 [Talaromyces pinophilus]
MLDIGEFQNGHSGRSPLLWVQGSLQDFVRETLSEANSLDDDGIKFETSFNVCGMVGIAGFKVELTSNLSDHLRFRDSDKTVKIFHHASLLEAHRKTSAYPPGIVDETLATLALFFPKGDKETERWYKKQGSAEELDANTLRRPKIDLGIKEYRYWHDRLVILKTEFDDSRPSTITQWWNDRRDVSQWYPLWVAISLTVLFGLVQSIEEHHRLARLQPPQGIVNITAVSIGGGEIARIIRNYRPGVAMYDFALPEGSGPNRAPGDMKSSWKWDMAMAHDARAFRRTEYRQALSQVNWYINQHRARYGFLLTNVELVAIRRLDGNGNIQLSAPIPFTRGGTAQNPQLTVFLALFHIGMLAAQDGGQDRWFM